MPPYDVMLTPRADLTIYRALGALDGQLRHMSIDGPGKPRLPPAVADVNGDYGPAPTWIWSPSCNGTGTPVAISLPLTDVPFSEPMAGLERAVRTYLGL